MDQGEVEVRQLIYFFGSVSGRQTHKKSFNVT